MGKTNWDQLLEKLSFAYNTSIQLTSQLTPFELQFGRKPNIPIDIVLQILNYIHEKK